MNRNLSIPSGPVKHDAVDDVPTDFIILTEQRIGEIIRPTIPLFVDVANVGADNFQVFVVAVGTPLLAIKQ